MIEASGGIDGKCGSTTVNLLIDFQRNYGLTPDGVCGQKTREALKKN
jgi:peptidoglycan hydrolase-like protein with peptidoglycan-binding domain